MPAEQGPSTGDLISSGNQFNTWVPPVLPPAENCFVMDSPTKDANGNAIGHIDGDCVARNNQMEANWIAQGGGTEGFAYNPNDPSHPIPPGQPGGFPFNAYDPRGATISSLPVGGDQAITAIAPTSAGTPFMPVDPILQGLPAFIPNPTPPAPPPPPPPQPTLQTVTVPGQQPGTASGTVATTAPPLSQGANTNPTYGTVAASSAGTGTLQGNNPPAAAADAIASQIQSLGGGPNALGTPDQWGFWYAQVTGRAAPAPEDLGFQRDANGNGTPIKFAQYWAAFRAATGTPAGSAATSPTTSPPGQTPPTSTGSSSSTLMLIVAAVVIYAISRHGGAK